MDAGDIELLISLAEAMMSIVREKINVIKAH